MPTGEICSIDTPEGIVTVWLLVYDVFEPPVYVTGPHTGGVYKGTMLYRKVVICSPCSKDATFTKALGNAEGYRNYAARWIAIASAVIEDDMSKIIWWFEQVFPDSANPQPSLRLFEEVCWERSKDGHITIVKRKPASEESILSLINRESIPLPT